MTSAFTFERINEATLVSTRDKDKPQRVEDTESLPPHPSCSVLQQKHITCPRGFDSYYVC
jgi:hypothetical protein